MMHDKPLNPEQKRRRRRIILGLLALIVVVPTTIVVVWEVSGKRHLEAAVQEARDIDRRLTIEEIIDSQEVWLDEENGALVLVEVFSELKALGEDPEMEDCPIIGRAKPPQLGRQWDTETASRVAELLTRHATILTAVDRLTDFEGGSFLIEQKLDPLATLLPHLANLRPSARLKSLQATQRVFAGDRSAFLGDLDALCALTDLIRNEPYLISALVAIAMDSLTIRTIECGCNSAVFSVRELGQLEDVLKQLDVRNRLYVGMVSERALVYGVPKLILDGQGQVLSEEIPRIPNVPILRGLLRRDMAAGIGILNRYIQAAQNPDTAYLAARRIEKNQSGSLPKYAVLSKILVPSLKRAFQLERRLEAGLRAARVALAIERYRIDRGLWPERLDALVPDYLEAIPVDPFQGQAMSYLVDDGTVVVYSIGDDETDNGGDVTYHRVTDEKSPTDWGFVLLPPERRNRPALPASMPAIQP